MIEPVIEALTSGYIFGPLASATRAMINSAALPNVALSRPPMPAPSLAARLSVARPISPANGMMARPETAKIHSSVALEYFSTSAIGKASNSQSSGCNNVSGQGKRAAVEPDFFDMLPL